MDLLEIMRNRRSVRKYTGERIDDEKIEKVLQAGMLSASSLSLIHIYLGSTDLGFNRYWCSIKKVDSLFSRIS